MSALPLFRLTGYRAHIRQQMTNPQNYPNAKVSTMDQKPIDTQFPETELVCEDGSWFIRALGPVEPLTVESVREMIEAARHECSS